MLSRRANLVILCLGWLLLFHPPETAAIDRDATEAFQAMAAAGIEYLNDPTECPGLINAQNLYVDLNAYTVIDIRSTNRLTRSGHIPGACHSSLGTLIDDLATTIPQANPT